MTPDRHRIQRQVLELTVGDASAAPRIQEQVARACREQLLAGMTSIFDAAAPAHELLRLDRMEIDVGRIEGKDWAPEFGRRLLAQLERELAAHARAARPTGAAEQGDAAGDEAAVFLYFLRHGRLPWWAGAPRSGWGDVFDALREPGIERLRSLLREEPRALTRVVDALDDARLEALVSRIGPLRNCARVMRELRPSESAPLIHRWRRAFWRASISWCLRPGDSPSGGDLIRVLVAERCGLALERPAGQQGPGITGTAGSRFFLRPVPADVLPGAWQEWWRQVIVDRDAVEVVSHVASAPRPEASPTRRKREKGEPEATGASADGIYLPCAGIVLLHPFLETLFRDRGLLDGRVFADDEARQRGAHLLGCLATGRADAPEYDLGLAKVLCGMDLEAPVESVWLDEDDIAACDALLAAVLGHWTALRSASAPWLRSQFFARDGKLEPVDGGHRLTVERRAQDVLLARLPWGFGVISLPWLDERIFVQWLD